ncbi:MgtC/SapB family protein [Halomonas sp. TRM85114]|uniref:MgtC/SapB family protein n=1 Tax=Halomonas jincaotanensis TaxID=2810616 RepID=UPI001BD54D14|nr:MgtC/SapB family protein [Halomonas jincaotanensis]MBS9405236.1 MgtC/SapB family protein [Halomonas jincaotanensis]
MEYEIPILDMLTRLAVAVGLALLLGLERELRGKPAGLRSHMLVSLGAATFTILGMSIMYETAVGDPSARIDPTRVIEGIIGGIGFLGAGSIIRSGGSISGLTTGASIWLAGAVGVAAGLNNFPLAGMVTALALVIIVVLGSFERELINKRKK